MRRRQLRVPLLCVRTSIDEATPGSLLLVRLTDTVSAVVCDREIWFPITIEISESGVIRVATHRVAHRSSQRLRKHGGSLDKTYQNREEKDGEKLCAGDGRLSLQLRTSGLND